MSAGIFTNIDRAGRVVIPKSLRIQLALKPGTRLQIRLCAGVLEIEPAPRSVNICRRGSVLVAEPKEKGDLLTSDEIRQTLDLVRRRDDRG